ncbi:MAG TPA: ECF-type sigma factor [Kofleriaceae bacterium]|jgi:RNA polymerase sigma factor (TIGR02999 family)
MTEPQASSVSILIGRLRDGEAEARDALVPLVYDELEAIARAYTHTTRTSLDPCGLVHELYLRLVSTPLEPRDRKHFFAIAALAMRQILVDRARRKRAAKRGGDAERVPLTGLASCGRMIDVLVIDEVLARLEALSPRQARIVELRCLLGMSVAEIADAIEVSPRTVHADWQLARTWLVRELAAS